jgi:hypothetical protein
MRPSIVPVRDRELKLAADCGDLVEGDDQPAG